MTIACIGYILAPNAAVVVVSRIINGVGFCLLFGVYGHVDCRNMLPQEKIGSGMGVYGTMNALAMAVAPAIGVSVYQRFGYRTAFCIALSLFCCDHDSDPIHKRQGRAGGFGAKPGIGRYNGYQNSFVKIKYSRANPPLSSSLKPSVAGRIYHHAGLQSLTVRHSHFL